MAAISTADCLPFMRAMRRGVGASGLLKALIVFGSRGDCRTAQSIANHLIAGKSLRQSFQKASPRLPQSVEWLLCRGAEESILDVVLDQIIGILEKRSTSREVSGELAALRRRLENRPATSRICDVCFECEFARLLKRAETEMAEEVILEQKGESFLRQTFISNRPVQVIEPSHSKTICTFRDKLEKAVAGSTEMTVQGRRFRVKQNSDSSFSLFRRAKKVLTISFQRTRPQTRR
jgi:hypothetical protein